MTMLDWLKRYWRRKSIRELLAGLEIRMEMLMTLEEQAVALAEEVRVAAVSAASKMDQILTKVNALVAAGGANDTELREIVSDLEEAKGNLTAVGTKQDEALTAGEVPAPAPEEPTS